jgi:hypothetical protein
MKGTKKGWDLVHGEIDSGDGPIGHAWLIRQDGEMIYDPVLGEEFATATYWLRFDTMPSHLSGSRGRGQKERGRQPTPHWSEARQMVASSSPVLG